VVLAMELSRDIVKDERFVNTYIPNVSGTLQKQPANDSKTAERATAMPGNRDR
ncbi:17449_t:CDS:2, partial [Rhizophagus irregularis]